MPRTNDLTMRAFGRLKAIRRYQQTRQGWTWVCRCECGHLVAVLTKQLVAGLRTSCGCGRKLTARARTRDAKGRWLVR